MSKADIVFSLIARAVGMERQAAELRALMDLYVDAVDEDMAELNVPEVPIQLQEPEEAVADMPESMPQTPDRQTSERDGYTGFLHLRCPVCGAVKTFCSKRPMQTFRCACGGVLDLEGLVEARTECECGKRSHYFTNCTEPQLDIPCIGCGAPAVVEYQKKDRRYRPIRVHRQGKGERGDGD